MAVCRIDDPNKYHFSFVPNRKVNIPLFIYRDFPVRFDSIVQQIAKQSTKILLGEGDILFCIIGKIDFDIVLGRKLRFA